MTSCRPMLLLPPPRPKKEEDDDLRHALRVTTAGCPLPDRVAQEARMEMVSLWSGRRLWRGGRGRGWRGWAYWAWRRDWGAWLGWCGWVVWEWDGADCDEGEEKDRVLGTWLTGSERGRGCCGLNMGD